jgi:MSHA biogenesis protein MshO
MTKCKGFTLIELISVMVVLSVLSIGVTSFIRSGVQIFNDVSERDVLLSQGRFVIERLNRELNTAVPNSSRVSAVSGAQCLEFVPIQWPTFYTNLPLEPSSDRDINIAELANISDSYTVVNGDFAIVYPLTSDDVYDTSQNKRRTISSCSDNGSDSSCDTNDSPDYLAVLTVDGAFAEVSPSSRLFIAKNSVSYCVRASNLYRHENTLSTNQTVYLTGGTLMAENIVNDLSDSTQLPFAAGTSTTYRNSITRVTLAFELNDETIQLSSDIHAQYVP